MAEDEIDDAPARRSHAGVEPLFAALEEESEAEEAKTSPSRRSRLGWKLFWAVIVLLALLAIVLNQAF